MPIYKKAQCIEIAIPKTGTTSRYSLISGVADPLDISMSANYGRCIEGCGDTTHPPFHQMSPVVDRKYNFFTHGHFTYNQLMKFLSNHCTDEESKLYNSFPTFCFVRNPYDRFVSMYHATFRNNSKNLFEFVESIYNLGEPISHHIFTLYGTQSEYILDQKNNIGVDFVCRLENLETDYNNLRNYIPHLPLFNPNIYLNKSANAVADKRNQSLNHETKQILYKLYEKDFKILGYDSEL